jgi:hypothetical protein
MRLPGKQRIVEEESMSTTHWRRTSRKPDLLKDDVLAWADEDHQRTGRWPNADSGPVHAAPAESWEAIDSALRTGARGCRPGGSLARLLERERGVRNIRHLPRLTIKKILAWADAHYERTGRWPSGWSHAELPEAPGENWNAINACLGQGNRGLPGRDSLAKVLLRHRGVRRIIYVKRLTLSQVLTWADEYLAKTGRWPTLDSGPVEGVEGVTWCAIDQAFLNGGRGLGPKGTSLAKILEKHRGMRHMGHLPKVTPRQILRWADAHRRRTGKRPLSDYTEVPEAPGEVWRNIDAALRSGTRGLPGGDTLLQFLLRHGRIKRTDPHVRMVLCKQGRAPRRTPPRARRQRGAEPGRRARQTALGASRAANGCARGRPAVPNPRAARAWSAGTRPAAH